MYNNKEFGMKMRNLRKSRGYTQENMCKIFGVKEVSSISRYESGELIPNIKQVIDFCEEFDISISNLFRDELSTISKKSSKNPFNTKTLYIYYKGYLPTSKRSCYLKFKIDIEEKDDYISATLKDIKTDKIYSIGYLNCNDTIAIFDFRNYEANSPMLSLGLIVVGIGSHMDGLFKGNLTATNDYFIPSSRKCLISKNLLDWNESMKQEIKYSDEELEDLKVSNILTTNIYIKEDYELDN